MYLFSGKISYQLIDENLRDRLQPNRDIVAPQPVEGATIEEPVEQEIDPDLLIDEDGNPVWVIEKVLEREKRARGTFHYLVKWKGYDDKDNSWITRAMAITPGSKKLLADLDAKILREA